MLDPDLQKSVADAVARFGIAEVSRRTGLSRHKIMAVMAGAPGMHAGTIAHARSAMVVFG
ncbi:MAG: hypothetical protein KIT84_26515 [Labilithrix sp.]|nr:hypothetical protein [Labilithrix sp.]